jgi:hypothetical protein
MKRTISLFPVVLVSFIVFSGCFMGAIYAVKYVKDMDKVILTMQTEGNAREIYDASVHANKTEYPYAEISEENRDKMIYEGKMAMKRGGELWFRWQMKQTSEGMTKVEVQLKGEGMEDKAMEEYAVRSIQAFCDEIGKRCEIKR